MARHREFDEGTVLDSAMKAFWSKGYEGTSISELESATQLSRGSLYKAFGDKQALFLLTLKRYLSQIHQKIRSALSSELPLQEALAASTNFLNLCEGESDNGCFALNSGFELGQQDPAVTQLLSHHREYVIRLLSERLELAQANGEIREEFSAQEVAELLMVVQAGTLIQTKLLGDSETESPHMKQFIALLLA